MKANPEIVVNVNMSLRDYFAAKAMQGYISGCLHIARAEYIIQSAVKSSYEIADAMLAAREAGK